MYLLEKIGTKHLIIGYNHHFGRRGEGDFNTVKQCTESLDFRVEQVEGLQSEGGAISSSSVREALLTGRLEEANKLLGYAYSVSGTVIEGRKIGRSIGFPQPISNLMIQHKLIPCNGVYAVEVNIGGNLIRECLVLDLILLSTLIPRLRSIEVHILNFSRRYLWKTISRCFQEKTPG